ncbi:hypothetical protein [Brevifollis gellanilyticus]|nr:hypothetical protein [Brevifollis gellanilyticus]
MNWITACLGLTTALAGLSSLHAEPRSWTNNLGKSIQAEYGGTQGQQVILIMPDGTQAQVPLASLSTTDRDWVRINPLTAKPAPTPAPTPAATASTATGTATVTARIPAEKRRMPDQVKEPLLYTTIHVVREDPGNCLYESTHFQFKTTAKLGVALMKDVCRAFESTYELVRSMPWGIQPKPEEGRTKFQAELYETRTQYLATNAPPWSAGVYSLKEKVFRIPFQELGISDQPGAGGAYYRKGEINNDTITHEITHQMMHEYVPFMPAWLVEGLAEYTSNLPYRGGIFEVKEDASVLSNKQPKSRRRGLFSMPVYKPGWVGLKGVWALTTDITTPNPLDTFTLPENGFPPPSPPSNRVPLPPEINMEQIASHYHSSHLLTFFFVRDHDGLPLKKYFDALHAEKAKWPPFWKELDDYRARLDKLKPAYDAYEAAMKEFMRKPGVQDLGGGKISYPSGMKLPAAPPEAPKPPVPPDRTNPRAVCIKHLDVLLNGRTLEQLDDELRLTLQKVGYSP